MVWFDWKMLNWIAWHLVLTKRSYSTRTQTPPNTHIHRTSADEPSAEQFPNNQFSIELNAHSRCLASHRFYKCVSNCFGPNVHLYTEIIGFESMLLCFAAHAKCENSCNASSSRKKQPSQHRPWKFLFPCISFCWPTAGVYEGCARCSRSRRQPETWKISVAHRELHATLICTHFGANRAMWLRVAVDRCAKKWPIATAAIACKCPEWARIDFVRVCESRQARANKHRTIQRLGHLAWCDECVALMQTRTTVHQLSLCCWRTMEQSIKTTASTAIGRKECERTESVPKHATLLLFSGSALAIAAGEHSRFCVHWRTCGGMVCWPVHEMSISVSMSIQYIKHLPRTSFVSH